MPLDKSQLEGLTQPLVDIYTELEQQMLINIAKLMAGNPNLLKDDPEAWKIQQIQNLGLLNKQNLQLIKKYSLLTSAQINQILYNAGITGLDETDGAMEKAIKKGAHLKTPKPVSESPALVNILRAYQAQAANVFNLTNQTMLKQSHGIYTQIINKTVMDVTSGLKTHDQALRSTIAQWAEYGVPALVDKGGKKWGTEGYVRMVINTTAHNTVHAMQDQRNIEYGIELVEVSSHSGARPLCAPYQGKIYSINGKNTKYKNLYTDTSYGKPAGLFGINCHHMKYPYIDGISTQTYFPQPKAENDEVYKLSQVQRAHEAGIRKAKTRYEMYKAVGDEEGMAQADQLIKDRQAELRDFIDQTGRTRRRDREQIVKVNDIPKKPLPKEQPKLPTDNPNIPQTVTKPDIPIPESIVSKEKTPDIPEMKPVKPIETKETPKESRKAPKTIKDVKPDKIKANDKIEFKDDLDEIYEGHVVKAYKIGPNAGKFGVDMNGTKIIVNPNDIISHTPYVNEIPKVDTSTYERLDSLSQDVKKDEAIFREMRTNARDDVAIVHKYTTSYYQTMNSYLRRNANDDRYLQKEIDHLSDVLNRYTKPFKTNAILFRQFDSDALTNIFGKEISIQIVKAMDSRNEEAIKEAKESLIGGAIKDKGFVSSTYKEGAYGHYMDCKMEIYVPKGYKNGLFVDSVSEYSVEAEYIFNKDAHFDIFDVAFEGGNIIFKCVPK